MAEVKISLFIADSKCLGAVADGGALVSDLTHAEAF
jgi:hypothetical protein